MSQIIAKDIVCKNCGQPLNGSKVTIACTDEVLGPRIVIKCSKCGYEQRFRLEAEER